MKIKFSPLLEVVDLLPLTSKRMQALPDIIDVYCGHIGIALYLYPISSWHWGFNIQKQTATINSCTPWIARYCREITLPTMYIEFAVF